MTMRFNALPSTPLQDGASCLRPVQTLPERVKVTNSALEVMTDLGKVAVISVRSRTSMDRANAKMIRYGIRMLVVLDDDERVRGLITSSDVLGEKPISYLQRMGGSHADITVGDVMTPQRELVAMNIQDVKKAKVGDILATLRKAYRQHAIVVSQAADGSQTVCGFFSITQIARQLGINVQSADLTRLFTEIEALTATE